MADNTPVIAQFLVEGAIYSLEQSGVLLRDSVTLYKVGSHGSAVVLAAFGREELGRYIILKDLHRGVVRDGKEVTRDDIAAACEDHVTKQERGRLSTVQRAMRGSGLGELMHKTLVSPPQSNDYRDAHMQLEDVRQRQEKRIPGDRHQARMDSLYVEPRYTGWNRPIETSSEEASTFLIDFGNDYAVQRDKIESGLIEYDQPEFAGTLKQWAERPHLPVPVWP